MTNHIGSVMVRVLALSAVDRVFEPRSGQTKNYKIGMRKLKLISLSLKRLVITNVKCSTVQMFGKTKDYKIGICCFSTKCGGRRGCDHMIVGFTTTCVISAYHH